MEIFMLIVLLTLFGAPGVWYYLKYKDALKEKLDYENKFNTILNCSSSPIRSGYYTCNVNQPNAETGDTYTGHVIFYVSEIDRYTSGESKIKLIDIEIESTNSYFNIKSCKDFSILNFKSIRKTSDINWLESEVSIKEMRREKLDKIKEAFK